METLLIVRVMTSRKLGAGTSGCVGRSHRGGSREAAGAVLTWPVPLQLSQQSRCPDFFLFLCRLLGPLLKAFAQAAAFLPRGQLPDTGKAHPALAVFKQGLRAQGRALPVPGLSPLSPQSRAAQSSSFSSYRPLPRRTGSLVSPPKQPPRAQEAGICCHLLSMTALLQEGRLENGGPWGVV